jgi:ComF family protein
MAPPSVSFQALATHASSLLDLLFPRHCAGCGGAVDRDGTHVCWDCFRGIELRGEDGACERCGLKVEGPVTHVFRCAACRADEPAFDRARSAGRFGGVLRELLLRFKYGRATWLRDDLAGILHGCVLAHFAWQEVDAVVPVPLHSVKRRFRGYNQAALLAGDVARRLDRPHVDDALVRVRATPTQTRLDAASRRRNVRGAFAVRDAGWVRGRTLLLIDDVMTTGATLDAASAALRAAGAWRVWAATVARG